MYMYIYTYIYIYIYSFWARLLRFLFYVISRSSLMHCTSICMSLKMCFRFLKSFLTSAVESETHFCRAFKV